jgi:hypothetical protein
VGLSEFVGAPDAALEFADCGPHAELVRGGGERDVLGLAQRMQVVELRR